MFNIGEKNMKTILNKINVDTTKQPLFLGEDLGIQRYDRFKYEVFFDLFKKQVNFFWWPMEFSLDTDRSDFKSLSDNEKFIFTSNLKYQTMLDSIICRGVPLLLEHTSNPELEACLKTWEFYEQIHSFSYTYIIKNVYSDPSEIFDNILNDVEIMKRAESAAKEYDVLKYCKKDNLKQQIYLTLVSINILEAVRFYVSFVCAFAFGENKKMMGNADIIKKIRLDESLHLAITQSLLNILRKEESEGFQDVIKENEERAIEMFAHAAEEEKAWAKHLFKDGSMLGLNEEILCQYIEFLVGNRMKNIGLPPLYNTKNPIRGWIEPWMNSEVVSPTPQEKELSQYKISASKDDLGDMKMDFKF